ncbi:MAG: anti-sigma factor antagonist [bacterium]
MKIQFEKLENTLIIKLYGEIDHYFAEETRDKIDREFVVNNYKNIIFDFEEVNFMDSSGIGMIIGRYKLTKERNGNVYAFGLRDNAKRVFNISGLNKIICYVETKEEAIKQLNK